MRSVVEYSDRIEGLAMRIVKVSVSLSEDQAALIGREVGAGHFPSTGAVIREALREWGNRRHHPAQSPARERSRLGAEASSPKGACSIPPGAHRPSGHTVAAQSL